MRQIHYCSSNLTTDATEQSLHIEDQTENLNIVMAFSLYEFFFLVVAIKPWLFLPQEIYVEADLL